ncbi:ABC transporter substrate-binding protein [Roseococcus sp. DSY-14]|uniref:ABC transporter substrate-binding protein n=1 Tax=Roseococcus sp. DSY-14 TaxID=3369650 RepID=UPI00387AFD83
MPLPRRALAGAGLAAALARPALAQARPVVLALQWDHQFQFAGYYAALWQGFFREAGFAAEIRSAFPDGRPAYRAPVAEVTAGRAQFGTGNAGILLAHARGAPIAVVATLFQQSGTRLYFRRGLREVRSPADLVGLRLGRNQGNELLDVELLAMLAAEGISPERLEVVRYAPDRLLRALAAGEYDMTFGYSLSAPWEQRELGVEFGELRPTDYGIAFYGDSLFADRRLARADPKLVEAFRDAALRGWAWALDNPEEVAERIPREFPRVLAVGDVGGFNRFQIPIVRELTLHPIVQLGNVNPERWERMNRLLARAGLVPDAPLDTRAFLFDPVREAQERAQNRQRLQLAALGGAAVLGGAAALWVAALRRTTRRVAGELAASQAALLQAQKMESLGLVMGGVAHDVNNLLQVVTSGLNLLEQGQMDDDSRAMVHDAMRRAVERGAAVNAQILAFAREQELRPARIEPAEQLGGMRPLLERALRSDIRLEMDLPAEAWPVLADPVQLEMALLNLAVNARDAMPRGGTLAIALSNEVLAERAGEPEPLRGEFLRIAPRDTGAGIPPELLAKVLEPFFTTKERGRGTGLGLAQAAGFARQSGGGLRIESTPGRGTTVSLLLPRDREGAAAPAPPPGRPAPPPRRLLLVEGRADMAALLRAALEEAGHEVRVEADAAGALAALARARPGFDAALVGEAEAAATLEGAGAKVVQLLPAGAPVPQRRSLRRPFTAEALEAALA